MASVSVQGRVDGAAWESIRQKGETNTEVLQRISAHYGATTGDELLAIAPTFDAAIAVLLNSHRLLNQLMQNAAIALPEKLSETTAPPIKNASPIAAQSADDW